MRAILCPRGVYLQIFFMCIAGITLVRFPLTRPSASYSIKPPGLGVQVNMDEDGNVIEVVSTLSEGSVHGDEKLVDGLEKQAKRTSVAAKV